MRPVRRAGGVASLGAGATRSRRRLPLCHTPMPVAQPSMHHCSEGCSFDLCGSLRFDDASSRSSSMALARRRVLLGPQRVACAVGNRAAPRHAPGRRSLLASCCRRKRLIAQRRSLRSKRVRTSASCCRCVGAARPMSSRRSDRAAVSGRWRRRLSIRIDSRRVVLCALRRHANVVLTRGWCGNAGWRRRSSCLRNCLAFWTTRRRRTSRRRTRIVATPATTSVGACGDALLFAFLVGSLEYRDRREIWFQSFVVRSTLDILRAALVRPRCRLCASTDDPVRRSKSTTSPPASCRRRCGAVCRRCCSTAFWCVGLPRVAAR